MLCKMVLYLSQNFKENIRDGVFSQLQSCNFPKIGIRQRNLPVDLEKMSVKTSFRNIFQQYRQP